MYVYFIIIVLHTAEQAHWDWKHISIILSLNSNFSKFNEKYT